MRLALRWFLSWSHGPIPAQCCCALWKVSIAVFRRQMRWRGEVKKGGAGDAVGTGKRPGWNSKKSCLVMGSSLLADVELEVEG